MSRGYSSDGLCQWFDAYDSTDLFYLSERKDHEELVLENGLPFETESAVPDVSTCDESTGEQAAPGSHDTAALTLEKAKDSVVSLAK